MKATIKNLNMMQEGWIIFVTDDSADSYTKIPRGQFKGMFESHLYSGDIYSAQELAEQMGDTDCAIIDNNNNIVEEEKAMANNAQVNITEIEVEGIKYTQTRPGYYYKRVNGKNVRISKAEWEQAFEAFTAEVDEADEEWDTEAETKARKDLQDAKDRETEQNFNKPTRKEVNEAVEKAIEKEMKKAAKPRRSKDIAHESNGVTLTAKQVDFIRHLPDTNFWENGLDSMPWCDVLADEIGGQFAGKPMTTGAMISTLREKGIINVGMEHVNGKKAKYLTLTDVGKQVAMKLGLN